MIVVEGEVIWEEQRTCERCRRRATNYVSWVNSTWDLPQTPRWHGTLTCPGCHETVLSMAHLQQLVEG